jgi:hypothetical protein
VMAQAGILHFFLTRRARGEPIQIVERQVWWERRAVSQKCERPCKKNLF